MTIRAHHLRPAEGAKTEKTRVGREGSKVRPRVAAPRAPRPARTCPLRWKAARCRSIMRLPKLWLHPTATGRVPGRERRRHRLAVLQGGTIGVDDPAAGAVCKNKLVKVLGDGDPSVAVNVTANKFTGAAKGEDHRRRWSRPRL